MKLNLAHQLLVAADEQTYGFLRVRGPELTYEVELLTDAGFVESSINRAGSEPIAVIDRVTDLGHEFMRAFGGDRQRSAVHSPSTGRSPAPAAAFA